MGTLFLDDLKDLLSTGGITSQVWLGPGPWEGVDEAVMLIETGGRPSDYSMSSGPGTGIACEWPRVQVLCRDTTYQGARQLAENVRRVFDHLPRRLVNGTEYKWGAALQPPFYLGDDDNNRRYIACNYEFGKAASTSTST